MANLNNERDFFTFLIYGSNKSQKINLLKTIDDHQYVLLRGIANDILDEIIPISREQFQILYQYKDFIRKLSSRKLSKIILIKNIDAIIELLKVVYSKDEMGKQTSSTTNRRMGKGEKVFTQEKSSKYSRGTTTSSNEETFTDNEYITDSEEEEEECWAHYCSEESNAE